LSPRSKLPARPGQISSENSRWLDTVGWFLKHLNYPTTEGNCQQFNTMGKSYLNIYFEANACPRLRYDNAVVFSQIRCLSIHEVCFFCKTNAKTPQLWTVDKEGGTPRKWMARDRYLISIPGSSPSPERERDKLEARSLADPDTLRPSGDRLRVQAAVLSLWLWLPSCHWLSWSWSWSVPGQLSCRSRWYRWSWCHGSRRDSGSSWLHHESPGKELPRHRPRHARRALMWQCRHELQDSLADLPTIQRLALQEPA